MNAATLFRAGWENFYVIIGSSAGALIGLQFVVMALISGIERTSTTLEVDAFGTPTVLHFVAVLILSLIASAPWPSLWMIRTAVGICGAAGLVYLCIAIRRARRQTGYTMVLEDWIWYFALPFVAYGALAAAALIMRGQLTASLFTLAGASLLLLCIGIHNAWDTVTYIAIGMHQPPKA